MKEKRNKQEIAQKYFEQFYNVNNPERARKIAAELLAADFFDHSPAFGAAPDKTGFEQTSVRSTRFSSSGIKSSN